MLISEFARAAGLTADTVRFYVRRGLLTPAIGAKGGRNPYQVFDEEHLRIVGAIRLGQALGMRLKDVAAIHEDHRRGRITREGLIGLMAEQSARLRGRAAELAALAAYLDAKAAWMRGGE